MISCSDIERADGVVDCRHRIPVDVLFCSLLVTGYFLLANLLLCMLRFRGTVILFPRLDRRETLPYVEF